MPGNWFEGRGFPGLRITTWEAVIIKKLEFDNIRHDPADEISRRDSFV